MKKLMIAVFLLSLCLAGVAFAGDPTAITRYSVEIVNDNNDAVTTQIPITTIRPKTDKIVGVSVIPTKIVGQGSDNTECFISLFDTTSTNITLAECIGEFEKSSGGGFNEDFDLRPRMFFNQITVRQGAHTHAQIYFVRE